MDLSDPLREAKVCRAVADVSHGEAENVRTALLGFYRSGLKPKHFATYGAVWQAESELLRAECSVTVDSLAVEGFTAKQISWLLTSRDTEADFGSLRAIAEELRDLWMRRELDAVRRQPITGSPVAHGRVMLERIQQIVVGPARGESWLSDVDRIDARIADDLKMTPISTGFLELDDVIGGWVPNLNLIAAMPGVGKSAMIATCIRSAMKAGKRVGLVSLEDGREWIALRFLAAASSVPVRRIQFGDMDEGQRIAYANASAAVRQYPGTLLTAAPAFLERGPYEMADTVSTLFNDGGCDVVFFDHFHEIDFFSAAEGSRMRGASEAGLMDRTLSTLRDVAVRANKPLVLATQLNRGSKDENEMPSLVDLKGTSGLEQKARVILALCREGDDVRCQVLKATTGKRGAELIMKFAAGAAMLHGSEEPRASWIPD